jgi:hypothetical protein
LCDIHLGEGIYKKYRGIKKLVAGNFEKAATTPGVAAEKCRRFTAG